ncbi:SDR family oxidoreductase [Kitasatospora sp. NA04385]|uniref:SDR family oxidoreductase n=1 Tax=Kitasatospora sp. NA04385 TaxID=2742135 RepID=UPI00159186E7|nr:SDR family oxidoreductase [Kitasatospora sp. NA04385]QKW21667.1 SDR family oxidoreductase [Kitasatospora sp. NA04385]
MSEHSDLRLAGRTAVVTGATRGVGLAVARRLRAGGARVVVNYAHSDQDAELALKELDGLPGASVAVRADVTTAAGLDLLLGEVRDRYGRLDVFVHNAAPWRPTPAVGGDAAAVTAAVGAALDPLLRGGARIAELMGGGPGRIVAVSSSGARSVVPRYVAAGVAKAALESLVRYLAVELAGRGITVNAVSTMKLDKGPATPQPEVAAALAARTPAGRLTTPEDLADVVALLCSPEAAWLHGQTVTADGGLGLL